MTLTAAQKAALNHLAGLVGPDKPGGQLASVSNGDGLVGYQTARALEKFGHVRVSPCLDAWWVEITDKGLALLAEVSELHSSTNAREG